MNQTSSIGLESHFGDMCGVFLRLLERGGICRVIFHDFQSENIFLAEILSTLGDIIDKDEELIWRVIVDTIRKLCRVFVI